LLNRTVRGTLYQSNLLQLKATREGLRLKDEMRSLLNPFSRSL